MRGWLHNNSDILAVLEHISDEIDHLLDGNLVFLSCDIDTLRGHPEVDQATGVAQTLVLIRDQIWKIEDSVYALGQEAKALLAVGVPKFPKLEQESIDPAWKQMQQLITDCVTTAQHLRRRERTVLGPVTHPKPGKTGSPGSSTSPVGHRAKELGMSPERQRYLYPEESHPMS